MVNGENKKIIKTLLREGHSVKQTDNVAVEEPLQILINNKIDYTNCSIELFLKNLLNNKTLFNDPYIKDNISNFIELYFYKNFLKNKNNLKFNDLRNVIIRKINLFKKFNLDIESLLLDFNNVLVNE